MEELVRAQDITEVQHPTLAARETQAQRDKKKRPKSPRSLGGSLGKHSGWDDGYDAHFLFSLLDGTFLRSWNYACLTSRPPWPLEQALDREDLHCLNNRCLKFIEVNFTSGISTACLALSSSLWPLGSCLFAPIGGKKENDKGCSRAECPRPGFYPRLCQWPSEPPLPHL